MNGENLTSRRNHDQGVRSHRSTLIKYASTMAWIKARSPSGKESGRVPGG